MSIVRFSRDACSPFASVYVSLTRPCTIVPDGRTVGDETAIVPCAVPPAGETTEGSTRPIDVALAGIVTTSRPTSAAPGAGTTSGGSTGSAATSAKLPSEGTLNETTPSAEGASPEATTTQACRLDENSTGCISEPERPVALTSNGPLAAADARRSNATRGDQPRGKSAGRPCCESRVRRKSV